MEAPYILISTISPEKGKKIDAFNKHTKYVSKVFAPIDFSQTFFEYAEEVCSTEVYLTMTKEYDDFRLELKEGETYYFVIDNGEIKEDI